MKTLIALVVFFTSFLMHKSSLADETLLTVKPEKCVALRKGQVCYQRLRLQFKTPLNGDYCLLASDQATPLRCWRAVSQGRHDYQLASDSAIEFTLTNSDNEPLTKAQVTIAWVYKKSRTRSKWRLF